MPACKLKLFSRVFNVLIFYCFGFLIMPFTLKMGPLHILQMCNEHKVTAHYPREMQFLHL